MKICIFSAQYLPTVGGVERYTYEFAKRAIRAGHSVCVVTSAQNGLSQTEISPEGIRIVRLPVWPLMNGRFPVPKRNALFHQLDQKIWMEEFDACIVQARFYPTSLYALRQTHRKGIPTILIDHSSGHLRPSGRLSAALGHCYEHLSAILVKRYCSHIYGVSNNVCRWLEHLGLKAEGVFYNSVDVKAIERVLSNGTIRNWREELGLDSEARIILFCGRLIPEKGILLLVEAVPKLKNENVHLLIAGDGPLMQRICGKQGEAIHVLGSLEHEVLLTLFSQSDVYCLPSESEGFATTLLEAAACRCPIVMTNTGGATELIKSNQYGVLLPNTKPETIAAALEQMLADAEWRLNAGRLLQRCVTEQFDWDITANRILNRLAELSGRKG